MVTKVAKKKRKVAKVKANKIKRKVKKKAVLKKRKARKEKVNYPIIRKKTLSNKYRKGKYIYLKGGKGQRGAYYKEKTGLDVEDYMKAYYGKVKNRQSGVVKGQTSRSFVKRVSKRAKVENILQRGYAEVTVERAEKLTPLGLKTAYVDLLTNKKGGFKNAIVRDKELAEILASDINVDKYKHRLAYEVDILGQRKEVLATLTFTHEGKSLGEVSGDIKKSVRIGMDFTENYKEISDTLVGKKGYRMDIREKVGRISSYNIKMVFRKA